MKVIKWQDRRGGLHDTQEAQVNRDFEIYMDSNISHLDTLYGCDISEIVEFVFNNKVYFDRLLKEREKEEAVEGG